MCRLGDSVSCYYRLSCQYPPPTSVPSSLQHFIRFNNFSLLLCGGCQLTDHIVKGRLHLRSCQPIPTLLDTISAAHPQWILLRDLFHGDVPVDCGWLLYSSKKINRLALQTQLISLAQEELKSAIPFICLCQEVPRPGQHYATITAPAIVICTSPPYQLSACKLLQEVLSPDEQLKFPFRYPFQRSMIFLSPHFLGLSDRSYASKLQEQHDFQSSEEAV